MFPWWQLFRQLLLSVVYLIRSIEMNIYPLHKRCRKKKFEVLKIKIKVKVQILHFTKYWVFKKTKGWFWFFLVWTGFWFCCCHFNFSFFFVLKTKRLLGLLITCISRHWHSHYIRQPQFWVEKVPCKRMHRLGRRREVNRIVP